MRPFTFSCRWQGAITVIVIVTYLSGTSSRISGSPTREEILQSSPPPYKETSPPSKTSDINPTADMTTRFNSFEGRITHVLEIDAFVEEREARAEYVTLIARVFGDRDWHTVTQRLYHTSIEKVCRLTPEQQTLIKKARQSWREGTRLKGSRNYRKALTSFEETSRIYQELLGDKDVWTIAATTQAAQIQQTIHQYQESKVLLEKIVPQVKALYGDADPCYAEMMQSLGVANFNLGSYEEAENQFRSSLKIQQTANGVESFPTSIDHYHLACLFNQRRKFSDAEVEAQAALKIVTRMLPDKYMENVITLWQLGKGQSGQEKYAETASTYARAVQLIDVYGISPPNSVYLEILDNYAAALHELRRDEEAAIYRTQADALRAKHSNTHERDK